MGITRDETGAIKKRYQRMNKEEKKVEEPLVEIKKEEEKNPPMCMPPVPPGFQVPGNSAIIQDPVPPPIPEQFPVQMPDPIPPPIPEIPGPRQERHTPWRRRTRTYRS